MAWRTFSGLRGTQLAGKAAETVPEAGVVAVGDALLREGHAAEDDVAIHALVEQVDFAVLKLLHHRLRQHRHKRDGVDDGDDAFVVALVVGVDGEVHLAGIPRRRR